MLIESPINESEEQFRAYLDVLLIQIYGRLPEWLEFRIGRRFERQSRFYREFICTAGSVSCFIQLHAGRSGGIDRSIILKGTTRGLPSCAEIRLSIETEFDCNELRLV